MVVGAVAQVLEHVIGGGKRRFADPVGPFAAHVGVADRVAVHPLRHVVTADARISAAAVGQFGGCVVRAARAEIGQTRRDVLGVVVAPCFGQGRKARLDAVGVAALFDQDVAQFFGNQDRVQRAACREQLQTTAVFPCVALVPAIDAAAVAVVKDGFLDLHLDQLALFLDDDDQVQTCGPFVEGVHVQRPGLSDLVGGDPQTLGLVGINVQQVHRVHQVQPVLARRDKADLGSRFAPHTLVHAVGAAERLGGVAFVVDDAGFLIDGRVDQTDVQAALGHVEVGKDKVQAVRIAVDHAGGFDGVLHGFQTDPQTGKPAERPAIKAVVHDFLHTGGRHHRHIGIQQREFGLVQHGRGFAGVVVAHGHQHAAVRRAARHVGVFEHVARAVQASAPSPRNSACWLPHRAVAARSSFRPG